MKPSSFLLISTLVSGGLALSIPFGLPGSIQSSDQLNNRAVQGATSSQPHEVRPRECEEPAEPEEPSTDIQQTLKRDVVGDTTSTPAGPPSSHKAALPHLYRGGNGSIVVNIINPTSRDPYPEWTLYAGSKGALDSMTKCWARELPREYGCTVNAVAPGAVDGRAIHGSPAVFKKRLAEIITKTNPVAPRLTQAAEVAWAVAMLCEDGAGWIKGGVVNVSGGLHSF